MRSAVLLITIASIAVAFSACGGAENTNVRVNTNSNSNVNRAPLPSPTPTLDRTNSNISREDYEKNRSEYEKDRGSSTIGTGANDSWLWFKTRAALLTTSDLRESTINVDVVNDVVTLKGTVGTAAEKTKAEQVAKGIDGVKSVKNELQVKPNDSMTNQMVNGNKSANANKK